MGDLRSIKPTTFIGIQFIFWPQFNFKIGWIIESIVINGQLRGLFTLLQLITISYNWLYLHCFKLRLRLPRSKVLKPSIQCVMSNYWYLLYNILSLAPLSQKETKEKIINSNLNCDMLYSIHVPWTAPSAGWAHLTLIGLGRRAKKWKMVSPRNFSLDLSKSVLIPQSSRSWKWIKIVCSRLS